MWLVNEIPDKHSSLRLVIVEAAVRRCPEGARDRVPGLDAMLPEARLFTDLERVSLLAAALVDGTAHKNKLKNWKVVEGWAKKWSMFFYLVNHQCFLHAFQLVG